MPDASPHLDSLTDAISRGRLALAEVAAIPPRELDAMFELAAQCLDAGRTAEAVHVLGGLVALFPFSGRFWRGYAVALHRQLEFERARAGYEASLALEPGHEVVRCYRAEVLIYLGEANVARRELETLLKADDSRIRHRARELLQRLPELAAFKGRAPPEPLPATTTPGADLPRFTIGGKRELPLIETQFMDGDDTMELIAPEVTSTARLFAPILGETTAPIDTRQEPTHTETAVIRHRRPAKPTSPAEAEAPLHPTPHELTHTAVVMRRAQLPLTGDEGSNATGREDSTALDGGAPPDEEAS
jgi:hypothetical protein